MDRLHASSMCELLKAAALASMTAVLVGSVAYAQDTTAGLAGQKSPARNSPARPGPGNNTVPLDPGPRTQIPSLPRAPNEPQAKTPLGTNTAATDGTGPSKIAEGLQPLSVARPGAGSKVSIGNDQASPKIPGPQGASQGLSQGSAQGTAQGSPQGTAQGSPQGTAQGSPQGTSAPPSGSPLGPEVVVRTPDRQAVGKTGQDAPPAGEMRRRADQNRLLPLRGDNENHVFANGSGAARANEAALVRDKMGRLGAFAQQQAADGANGQFNGCGAPNAPANGPHAQPQPELSDEDWRILLGRDQRLCGNADLGQARRDINNRLQQAQNAPEPKRPAAPRVALRDPDSPQLKSPFAGRDMLVDRWGRTLAEAPAWSNTIRIKIPLLPRQRFSHWYFDALRRSDPVKYQDYIRSEAKIDGYSGELETVTDGDGRTSWYPAEEVVIVDVRRDDPQLENIKALAVDVASGEMNWLEYGLALAKHGLTEHPLFKKESDALIARYRGSPFGEHAVNFALADDQTRDKVNIVMQAMPPVAMTMNGGAGMPRGAGSGVPAPRPTILDGHAVQRPPLDGAAVRPPLTNVGRGGKALDGAFFAQKDYGKNFSKDGALSGRPVRDVAANLMRGTLKPEDVPVEFVRHGNSVFILNTRSSNALELAGIPRSMWRVRDMTGQADAEGRMQAQFTRNKLDVDGFRLIRPEPGKNFFETPDRKKFFPTDDPRIWKTEDGEIFKGLERHGLRWAPEAKYNEENLPKVDPNWWKDTPESGK
jgi:hypothetical protein